MEGGDRQADAGKVDGGIGLALNSDMGDIEDDLSKIDSLHANDLPGHQRCQFRHDRPFPFMGRVHCGRWHVFHINGLSGL